VDGGMTLVVDLLIWAVATRSGMQGIGNRGMVTGAMLLLSKKPAWTALICSLVSTCDHNFEVLLTKCG
jgi:hypothetical protein